jgi:DNA-binding CsgD family transcriptional regulator
MSQLRRAPFEPGRWLPALAATANATGSASAGLQGMTPTGQLTMGLSAIWPASALREIVRDATAFGASDPRRNQLLARTLGAPVLCALSDADVLTDEERKRHPLWNEFYPKFGFSHVGLCLFLRRPGALYGLQLVRTARQGPLSKRERRIYRRIAVYWRDAVLLSRALKEQGAQLLEGALETLSIPAIVVDRFGQIVAMTPAAETIVRGGSLFRISGGRLDSALERESPAFEREMRASIGTILEAGRISEIRLRDQRGGAARVRMSPLPCENDIGFGAAAMIVVENRVEDEDVLPSAIRRFGFTPAETEIARAVLAGKPVRNIARARDAAYETVRAQIKSIYSKAGVRNRAEFMARRRT